MSAWDDSRCDGILERLWPRGFSGTEIAAVIQSTTGHAVTRNAVISRAHRVGLPNRSPRRASVNTRQTVKKIAIKRKKLKRKVMGRARGNVSLFVPVEIQDIELPATPADGPPTPIVYLRGFHADGSCDQCRWPLDGGACAKPTVRKGAGVYCQTHADLCYKDPPTPEELRKIREERRKKGWL